VGFHLPAGSIQSSPCVGFFQGGRAMTKAVLEGRRTVKQAQRRGVRGRDATGTGPWPVSTMQSPFACRPVRPGLGTFPHLAQLPLLQVACALEGLAMPPVLWELVVWASGLIPAPPLLSASRATEGRSALPGPVPPSVLSEGTPQVTSALSHVICFQELLEVKSFITKATLLNTGAYWGCCILGVV
jgi:hypothetical protein